jgi:hypothetical protein
MKTLIPLLCLASLFDTFANAGESQLFNSKDLSGWSGHPEFWSVQDGAITGKTSKEKPTKGNTFLIYKEPVADFELHIKYRFAEGSTSGNSGIQYRSKVVDPANFVVAGYQADMEVGKVYSGILYEEKGRGILAKRGQKVIIREGQKPEAIGETDSSEDIQASIKVGEWNDYKIIAKGGHLQHFINGKLTVDVTDETAVGAKTGVLALQLHAGPPMEVQFKDIVLKTE